uniref:Uncharacterized protein n=1 Tax=Globisporangium ultimum (strain ATCC 200006 / CBS 805.95 / DAOM BR144) TaxID=431595 RepID=K3XAT2_GLOUD
MERRGVGKRLTDGQRVEIIKLFDSGAAVTEADIARRYGVTRSAIWRLRRASSQIMERYQEGDIESRDERRRGSITSSNRQFIDSVMATASTAPPPAAASASVPTTTALVTTATAASESGESEPATINVDSLTAMTTGASAEMLTPSHNNNNSAMMLGMIQASNSGVDASPSILVGVNAHGSGAGGARPKPRTGGATGAVVVDAGRANSDVELVPGTVMVPDPVLPLIYLAAKAIGSVQSPGVINWERQNGYDDANHFLIVNDGISVVQEGNYQLNIDIEHSQPRQNYKFTFKVWNGKKLLGQCTCPIRTKKEISLSLLELRCKLQAQARLRVEFLAPGFAFHESRFVIRLVQ